MAPNKKKKKAAANPARGFATVSIASKPKESEQKEGTVSNEGSKDDGHHEGISPPAANGPAQQSPADGGTAIEDMTPEELEAHLEDSELQSLLDANAARCRSDVIRQVSRLQVERRQLRGQSHKLATREWPEGEAIERVLLSCDSYPARHGPISRSVNSNEPKQLLDLWILQRVLLALKLPHLADVMTHIVLLALSGGVSNETGMIWGLSEAFDWYALHGSRDELPDYDSDRAHGDPIEEDQLPLPTTETEENDTKPLVHQIEDNQNSHAHEASESESEVSDGEGDDDPARMQGNWLQLQIRKWRRERRYAGEVPKTELKSRKLQDRISGIERDILFDKDLAQAQWMRVKIELQTEEALKTKNTNAAQAKVEPGGEDSDSQNAPARDADGGEELFGDLFTAPGEELHEQQGSPDTPAIRLIDFGKWSGLSPKQLLEQICRSIDAKPKVKIIALHQTNYSVRHKLSVSWSSPHTPEHFAIAALPEGTSHHLKGTAWSVEMTSVATPNVEQSLAYVSTLMLFLISSLDGQDQQSTIRLPTVWRDEYAKLSTRRKELINHNDKAELKELRKLIKKREDETSQSRSAVVDDRRMADRAMNAKGHRKFETTATNPARIAEDWAARSSTETYQEMQAVREQLPIYQSKDLILQTIADHPISIVCAETGSGKSTQTGSYLLEHELSQGRNCRILVTQPRRISAISLARRVSVELGEGKNDLGTLRSLVGYAIRLESKTSASTRLTFATTGVLLRMLESSPQLEQLDYLILDEVHERTLEMDLLFIALRQLQQKRPSLKIALMSATVDARKFSEYFGNAPVLDIPGRMYPVEIQFLEDAIEETNDVKGLGNKAAVEPDEISEVDPDRSRSASPSAAANLENYSAMTRKKLSNMDQYGIDYELITKLATAIATKPKFSKYSPAILIFMPGIAEIRRLHNGIISTDIFGTNWDIHMLHSSFSTEELERAFAMPARGRGKIVIATNIAETGITIPDVTAVIDTCKEKIMRFDERRQLSKLTEGFISRSSAKQRRGRAARVQEGLCFHLVTKHRHDNLMLEQQVPEMMRLSLQDPILRVKIWNMGSVEETFQAAIDPPSRKNVMRAVERLKDAGALTKSENLTALGQRIARLPLDVTFAKLAILGAIFQCVGPVLGMISILSSKSIFLPSSGVDPRSLFARSDSDILSSLSAYEGWKKAKIAGKGADFCRKHHLSDQNLTQVEDQKVQLLVYLVDGGLLTLSSEEKATLNKHRVSHMRRKDFYQIPERYGGTVSDDLLLSLIAMSFYPRILIREGRGYRNVYMNQHVSLRRESVNHGAARPPKWLSFSEAMQTKTGNLNVFETSRIPDVALACLLGDAEIKMFSGVVSIDNGKIKLAVRHWRQALALKRVRKGVREMLDGRYTRPDEPWREADRLWIDVLAAMTQS